MWEHPTYLLYYAIFNSAISIRWRVPRNYDVIQYYELAKKGHWS